VHTQGTDTEGIFSLRKVILEIIYQRQIVGFCVLTEKVGACVKTGPVIFDASFRNKGFGQKLRRQLHQAFKSAGYRKVYCTVPAISDGPVGYLLASDYKIEAHLRRQYHDKHNEFVLGFSLTDERASGREYIRHNMAASSISHLKKGRLLVSAFMQQEFSETFCRLPNDWAAHQIKYATDSVSRSSFKPREVYVAEAGHEILAAALCVPKRGGATKILIASRTSHLESLMRLLCKIEEDAWHQNKSLRKIYSLVSVFDATLQNAFYLKGFRSEGVLDRPYKSSDDLIVLSKMLARDSAGRKSKRARWSMSTVGEDLPF
jgi:hypothetical protein